MGDVIEAGDAQLVDFIEYGKEKDATKEQLKRIFGTRYNNNKEFKPSWVSLRKNPLEKYVLILEVNGNNKLYQCLRCQWSRKGFGKLVLHKKVFHNNKSIQNISG